MYNNKYLAPLIGYITIPNEGYLLSLNEMLEHIKTYIEEIENLKPSYKILSILHNVPYDILANEKYKSFLNIISNNVTHILINKELCSQITPNISQYNILVF